MLSSDGAMSATDPAVEAGTPNFGASHSAALGGARRGSVSQRRMEDVRRLLRGDAHGSRLLDMLDSSDDDCQLQGARSHTAQRVAAAVTPPPSRRTRDFGSSPAAARELSPRLASVPSRSNRCQDLLVGIDVPVCEGQRVRILEPPRFVSPWGTVTEIRCAGQRVGVVHDDSDGQVLYYNTGKRGEFQLAAKEPDATSMPSSSPAAPTSSNATVPLTIERQEAAGNADHSAASSSRRASYADSRRSRSRLPAVPDGAPISVQSHGRLRGEPSTERRRSYSQALEDRSMRGISSSSPPSQDKLAPRRSSYLDRRRSNQLPTVLTSASGKAEQAAVSQHGIDHSSDRADPATLPAPSSSISLVHSHDHTEELRCWITRLEDELRRGMGDLRAELDRRLEASSRHLQEELSKVGQAAKLNAGATSREVPSPSQKRPDALYPCGSSAGGNCMLSMNEEPEQECQLADVDKSPQRRQHAREDATASRWEALPAAGSAGRRLGGASLSPDFAAPAPALRAVAGSNSFAEPPRVELPNASGRASVPEDRFFPSQEASNLPRNVDKHWHEPPLFAQAPPVPFWEDEGQHSLEATLRYAGPPAASQFRGIPFIGSAGASAASQIHATPFAGSVGAAGRAPMLIF